jgi:hypothetical protein
LDKRGQIADRERKRGKRREKIFDGKRPGQIVETFSIHSNKQDQTGTTESETGAKLAETGQEGAKSPKRGNGGQKFSKGGKVAYLLHQICARILRVVLYLLQDPQATV